MNAPRITPTRALTTFALAQVPLILVAAALDWRRYLDDSDVLANVALNGSAISGPLTAQLQFLLVAWLATRGGRLGTVAHALTVLAGLAITYNGVASLFAEREVVTTPHAALLAGSIAFTVAGIVIVFAGGRALRRTLGLGRSARVGIRPTP